MESLLLNIHYNNGVEIFNCQTHENVVEVQQATSSIMNHYLNLCSLDQIITASLSYYSSWQGGFQLRLSFMSLTLTNFLLTW